MPCPDVKPNPPTNFVPVSASVVCEAPGVIYVNIDPDVWKIRCRQCQEKTEHKCALKRLKNKFRGDPSKRRIRKIEEEVDDDEEVELPRTDPDLAPAEALPDDCCDCSDRPADVIPRAFSCLCDTYRELNFSMQLSISGEFKPAFFPKVKKGRNSESSNS